MIEKPFEKVIRDFIKFFSIDVKDITFTFNGTIPVVKLQKNNEVIEGLRNLISYVSKAQKPEILAVEDQWSEYILNSGGNIDSISLKDLNNYLADKIYFVENQQGPIDVFMFYLLHNVMAKLSFLDKEKYMHISRWFNQVQQSNKDHLGKIIITFSRCCLYT